MPKGIMIFGLNGCGKSTLARALSSELGYKYMDIEDYVFIETEIPYTKQRSREDYIRLMTNDIKRHKTFVMSAVRGNFGDHITSYYKLGVFIDVPYDIRIQRVEQRMKDKFGDRVEVGGDMYETEMKFLEFVKARTMDKLNMWSDTLSCQQIRVDGTLSIKENVAYIKDVYNKLMEVIDD